MLSSRSWHKMRALVLNRSMWNVLSWNTKWHGMNFTHLELGFLVKNWVLSKNIPLSWMYLAAVLRKLGWNGKNDKLLFIVWLGFFNLEFPETQRTQIHWDRSQRKRLSLFSFTLVCTSSWHLARTHIEKFNKSLNKATQLSFCTMKADIFQCDTRESYAAIIFLVQMRDFVQEEDGCNIDKANNL